MKTAKMFHHRGPHLGIVAIAFTLLFNTGLFFVISPSGTGLHFPGPWEPEATIIEYFQTESDSVLWCAFLQFCSAIPFGIFTAAVVSRIGFLGSKAAGNNIALFGGFMAAFNIALSALLMWVTTIPQIAMDPDSVLTLYYTLFIIGGVGYSVPLGLLIAGISITSWFMRTLPRWLTVSGVLLALIGELSCLSMVFHDLLFLIPLTRFPGFIWLIIAGFKLPLRSP